MKGYWLNLRYILIHKWFVFVECRKVGIGFWQAMIHDWSKFSGIEFKAYTDYFARNLRDKIHDEAFNRAWLHHIHRNPHHWQHWVLRTDQEGIKVLRMPEMYVREMVADWRGVGRTLGLGADNAVVWYRKNKDTMALHPQTRHRVEELLGIVESRDTIQTVERPKFREIGTN